MTVTANTTDYLTGFIFEALGRYFYTLVAFALFSHFGVGYIVVLFSFIRYLQLTHHTISIYFKGLSVHPFVNSSLGKYKIVRLIKRGGMGAVYEGLDSGLQRSVAIKVIETDDHTPPDFAARFQKEAQIVAALTHPHILQVYDYGKQDNFVYLVMPLITGGTLADHINRGPLPLSTVDRFVTQIAGALQFAHLQGIVHRDLKPQNVLLNESGNVFLADFGIAKVLSETTRITNAGFIVGTPHYMSPEQWDGKEITPKSDIYALGIVIFEMLTGQLPYQAETPYALMQKHMAQPMPSMRNFVGSLPEAVEAVVYKATAKNMNQRFEKADDVSTAFSIATRGEFAPGLSQSLEELRRASGFFRINQEDANVPVIGSPAPSNAQIPAPNPTPAKLPKAQLLVGAGVVIAAFLIGIGGVLLANQPDRGKIAAQATLVEGSTTPLNSVLPTFTAPAVTSITVAPTLTTVPPTTAPTLAPANTSTPKMPTQLGESWVDPLGVAQVFLPKGCFKMGNNITTDRNALQSENPQHEVCLAHSVLADKFETTNESFQKFVAAGGYTNKEFWSEEGWAWLQRKGGKPSALISDFDAPAQPRVNVTWYEAQAYAKWRGGRLPTEAEWEYMARGSTPVVYPWGDEYVLGAANLNENSLNGASLNKTNAVGSYKTDRSWVGCFDLIGNAQEWVQDWYDADYYAKSPSSDPRGAATGKQRVARGGSYNLSPVIARAAYRASHLPDETFRYLGFRIVTEIDSVSR